MAAQRQAWGYVGIGSDAGASLKFPGDDFRRARLAWPTLQTSARHRIRHEIRHTATRAGRRPSARVANDRLRHILIGYARVIPQSLAITWPLLYRQFGADPAKATEQGTVDNFRRTVYAS